MPWTTRIVFDFRERTERKRRSPKKEYPKDRIFHRIERITQSCEKYGSDMDKMRWMEEKWWGKEGMVFSKEGCDGFEEEKED